MDLLLLIGIGMAQIYPDYNESRVVFASKAEENFYEICKKLPKEWSVYYSCTLSALEPGRGLQDNEIDFVLYQGIAVVKSGFVGILACVFMVVVPLVFCSYFLYYRSSKKGNFPGFELGIEGDMEVS